MMNDNEQKRVKEAVAAWDIAWAAAGKAWTATWAKVDAGKASAAIQQDSLSHCDAQALRDLAAKDIPRLCESFYKAANRLDRPCDGPRTDHEIIIVRGRGPTLCVTQGYGDFKASYHKAAAEIKASVVPYLTGTEDRLDLCFVSFRDSNCNSFQPSAHAVWIIYRTIKP